LPAPNIKKARSLVIGFYSANGIISLHTLLGLEAKRLATQNWRIMLCPSHSSPSQ
jgi:hypothetical protein